MKSNGLTITRTLLKFICLAIFIFLLAITPVSTNEVKAPIFPYETYEEEYIAAIDNYINTGEVIIPEGTIFSTDGETITIESNEADAWVNCRFVLDNTIPVYESHYDPYNHLATWFRVIVISITPFALYFILNSCVTKIYSKHHSNKKAKVLNIHKKTAKYGDNRTKKANCKRCNMLDICKCIHCVHLGNCGNCPSNDCEYAFEEILHETKKLESDNSSKEQLLGKCDVCDNNTTCECIDCSHADKCIKCPSENCAQDFEVLEDVEEATLHTNESDDASKSNISAQKNETLEDFPGEISAEVLKE